MQLVERDLEDCELQSPYTGTVVHRHLDEGAVVQAGAPLFDLIESDRLEIHVGLPEYLAAVVRVGDKKEVLVANAKFEARVKSIINQLDPVTRTRKIILETAEESAQTIIAGQIARVRFETEVAEAGFWIPDRAIITDQRGLWSCFTVELDPDGSKGRLRRQAVEVLFQETDRVFVRGTLRDGQWIVADGMHRYVDGQQVLVQRSDDSIP